MLFRSKSSGASTAESAQAAASPLGEKESPRSAPAGPLTIYFGSQTGTAEGFSEQLKQQGDKNGFAARVVDLDDFEEEDFKANCSTADSDFSPQSGGGVVVLVLATYGEGDPTDNAAEFVKWLRASKGDDGLLRGLKYCVFALGNRQYEHFNKVGKYVDKALEELGGERVFDLGVGDDDGDMEEDFEGWRERLWPALLEAFHPAGVLGKAKSADDLRVLATGLDGEGAVELPKLPFTLELAPPADQLAATRQLEASAPPPNAHTSTKHLWTATRVKVVANSELRTPKDPGSTRHIEVDIHSTGLSYETADNLAVLPENPGESVEHLAQHMGYDLGASIVALHGDAEFKPWFPTPCTVREALQGFVDLSGPPKRTALKDWARFAADPREREELLLMAGKTQEGKDRYREQVEQRHASLGEVVTSDFKSLRVPLAHFLHLAPHLQPRYYTISSSSSMHPKRIHATVSVIEQAKSGGGTFKGVCSAFLQGCDPPATDKGKRTDGWFGSKPAGGEGRGVWPSVRVFVRASSFRLPSDPKTPIVLVGPGTGIAPMRALLQERHHQKATLGLDVGPAVLYFGCKRPDQDFLYQEELEAYKKSGALTEMHCAFSRLEAQPKQYVQHLMARPGDAKALWALLHAQGAHLYVCGGTSMGADVQEAVGKIAGAELGGAAKADAWVNGLKAQGKYVQELWS